MPVPPAIPPALAANPWFAGVPAAVQGALLAAAEPLALPGGAMLFRQGDGVDERTAFYALVAGTLRVSSLRADGREAILVVLEAGNWLGEISLLDGAPRTHDATGIGPCQLLAVPAPAFHRLMGSAAFASAIAGLMAGRVRALYGLMEDATLRSLRARVARRLLALAHGDATQTAALRTAVRVPQESLAMMLGITRQTLSKELRALADAGAIRIGYRRVEIADAAVLTALAA